MVVAGRARFLSREHSSMATAVVAAVLVADAVCAHGLDGSYVPRGDDLGMWRHAADRLELWRTAGLWAAWREPLFVGAPYPPLVTMVGAAFGRVGGYRGVTTSLALWDAVGLVAAMVAGTKLVGRWGGVLGAITWFWLARSADSNPAFYGEVAVGPLVLATLVALESSRWLERPVVATLAGLLAGLALLAKFTAAPLAGPAVVGVLAASAVRALVRDRGWLPGLALALPALGGGALALVRVARWAATGTGSGTWAWPLGVAVLPLLVGGRTSRAVLLGAAGLVGAAWGSALSWYGPAHGALLQFLSLNESASYNSDPLPFALALRFDARVVLRQDLDGLALLAVLVGIVGAVRRREALPLVATAAALVGLVAMAALPYQNVRYVAPIAVLFVPAVLSAVPRRWAGALALVAVAWCAALLTTRAEPVRAAWMGRFSGEAFAQGRLDPDTPAGGTQRVLVERWLDQPVSGFAVLVALPADGLSADPIFDLAARVDAACPPHDPIRLGPTAGDVGATLPVVLAWEHRRTVDYFGKLENSCFVTVTAEGEPPTYAVRVR